MSSWCKPVYNSVVCFFSPVWLFPYLFLCSLLSHLSKELLPKLMIHTLPAIPLPHNLASEVLHTCPRVLKVFMCSDLTYQDYPVHSSSYLFFTACFVLPLFSIKHSNTVEFTHLSWIGIYSQNVRGGWVISKLNRADRVVRDGTLQISTGSDDVNEHQFIN